LTGERLEMLCVDGGAGLLAALPTAFPDTPVQRCWAHKIRNVLNQVRKADQAEVKPDLHRIMNARTLPVAWSAARRFADHWQDRYPRAVACLRADLAAREPQPGPRNPLRPDTQLLTLAAVRFQPARHPEVPLPRAPG
jgi:transposase-like protein